RTALSSQFLRIRPRLLQRCFRRIESSLRAQIRKLAKMAPHDPAPVYGQLQNAAAQTQIRAKGKREVRGSAARERRVPRSLRFWQGAGDGGGQRVSDCEVVLANFRLQSPPSRPPLAMEPQGAGPPGNIVIRPSYRSTIR